MSHSAHVKATPKAIRAYYQTLTAYRAHDVGHETALRSAFQNLLAEIAKTRHWLLVPEQSTKIGGKKVVPDGTLCDEYNLHRDYWEAKDTDDKLNEEIAKKIKKGYPLSNIIFEDTRQAVLFQGKREVLRVDLSQPQNVADLLNQFFAYTEPEHEDFAKAVEEFKDRVPDLARGLAAWPIARKFRLTPTRNLDKDFQHSSSPPGDKDAGRRTFYPSVSRKTPALD
jgi:hypothetical protein